MKMHLSLNSIVFQILTASILLVSRVYSICNVYSGPEGELDCRSFSWIGTASGNQWARCVSKDRLRNITNGGLTCIFNFCNYLCMQEYYDLSAGEIYSDCRCQSEDINNVDKNRTYIEDNCYKPTGSDCDWFDTCLGQRYSNCSQSISGDKLLAIEFEQRFCRLYEQKNEFLSDLARQWIGQVRKCFVDKIAILIRPWRNDKCEDVEEAAFLSHKQCYLKPDSNIFSSICQLDCKSWWLIFKEMKNFFPMSNQKLHRILNQYFKFGIKGCDGDAFFSRCWADKTVLDDFKKNFLFYRVKFTAKQSTEVSFDANSVAYELSKKIILDNNIDTHTFDWYSNLDESSSNTFILYIVFNHGVEKFDSSATKETSNSAQLLKTVTISLKSVENKIPFEAMDQVSLIAFESCFDPLCQNVSVPVTSQTTRQPRTSQIPLSNSNARIQSATIKIFSFLNIFYLIIW